MRGKRTEDVPGLQLLIILVMRPVKTHVNNNSLQLEGLVCKRNMFLKYSAFLKWMIYFNCISHWLVAVNVSWKWKLIWYLLFLHGSRTKHVCKWFIWLLLCHFSLNNIIIILLSKISTSKQMFYTGTTINPNPWGNCDQISFN